MRWIVIAALAVIAGIIGGLIGVGAWRAGATRTRLAADLDPSDQAIIQALRQARADSAAPALPGSDEDKSRWMAEVKGFDVSDLPALRRDVFVRLANAQRCTCGCGYTLAGCRTYDPSCPVSGPRVEKLLDSVRAGHYSSAARDHPRRARRG